MREDAGGVVRALVGGLPGSGTTLLVKTLDRHPQLAGFDETQLVRVLGTLRDKLLAPDSELRARYLSRFFSDDDLRHACRGFADGLLLGRARQAGKRGWVEKSPYNFRAWQLWKSLFPEARLLFVIRDGRDVVSSGVAHGYYGVAEGARRWVDGIRESREQSAPWPDDYLELRYEDLLRQPRTTLARVCEFLGVRFAPELLQLARSPKFVRQWGAAADPRTPIGRWHRDPAFDPGAFEREAGSLLQALGYESECGEGGALRAAGGAP